MPVTMKVVQSMSQVVEARREMERQGVSSIEPRWRSILRRAGASGGLAVGDFIKSWDVLETIKFASKRVKADEPILDIGCYASEVLVALHKMGYTNLSGADLDPKISRMPYQRSIRYEVCDFMHTPFEDQSFAAITSISVIEHGFDPEALLAEMSRLLKPGGYFIASFDYWPEKLDTSGIKFFGMDWKIFSKQECIAFIEQAAAFGMRPIDDLQFDVTDTPIDCWGRKYTFAWLVLEKTPDK